MTIRFIGLMAAVAGRVVSGLGATNCSTLPGADQVKTILTKAPDNRGAKGIVSRPA